MAMLYTSLWHFYISCGVLCDTKVLHLHFYVQWLHCYRDEYNSTEVLRVAVVLYYQ